MVRANFDPAEMNSGVDSWRKHRAAGGSRGRDAEEKHISNASSRSNGTNRRIQTAHQHQEFVNVQHGGTGAHLVKQGVECHQNGQYDEALKYFQAALEVQVEQKGEIDPIVAHTMANIGAVVLRQGRLSMAQSMLEKALEMKEYLRDRATNEEEKAKIPVADVLNNLGNLAYLHADYEKSMDFYCQALGDLSMHSDLDKNLANTLHNMGRLHVIRQEWDSAFRILAQCRDIEIELFGSRSPELAGTMELIGYVHLSKESFHEAMALFSEALSIHQEHLGSVHENVATALVNIAMAMEGQGDFKNACHTYATSKEVYKQLNLGKEHRGFKAAIRGYDKMISQLHADQRKSNNRKAVIPKTSLPDAQRDECNSSRLREPSGRYHTEYRS